MDALTGGAFIGAGLVQAAISVALFLWGSTVAARRGGRAWWWARWMPLVALLLATGGVIVTVIRLVTAFDAVATVDASLKAQVLSEAIDRAMRWALLTTLPSWGLYVASVVAFTAGTLLPVATAAPGSRTVPPAPARPGG